MSPDILPTFTSAATHASREHVRIGGGPLENPSQAIWTPTHATSTTIMAAMLNT
jgi:hypothetical protein